MNYGFEEGLKLLMEKLDLTLPQLAKKAEVQAGQFRYFIEKGKASDLFLDKMEYRLGLEPGYWKRHKFAPAFISSIHGTGNNAVNSTFIIGNTGNAGNTGAAAAPAAAAPAKALGKEGMEYEIERLELELSMLRKFCLLEYKLKCRELDRLMKEVDEMG